jgi:hypothetical protein
MVFAIVRRFDAPSQQPQPWTTGDYRAANTPTPRSMPYAPRVAPSTYSGVVLNDHSAPSSLAPHAMGVADASSSHRVQTVVIRERSGVKTGLGILAIGALVGVLLGVAMRVQQSGAADSTANAVAAPNEAVPVPVAVAPGPVATQPAPPQVPAAAYANNAAAPAPATPAKDSAKGTKKGKRWWAAPAAAAPAPQSHSIVAANVPDAPPAPVAVKEPPKAKEPKVKEPVEPKEPKEPKDKKAASAEHTAAVNALKAAQTEGELSLSGGK